MRLSNWKKTNKQKKKTWLLFALEELNSAGKFLKKKKKENIPIPFPFCAFWF